MRKQMLIRYLLICFVLFAFMACSTASSLPILEQANSEISGATDAVSPQLFWWRASFINHLAEDEAPDWVSDLLVADLVVEPVLDKFADSLALWRFHRRAVHDNGGHIFSFIFYSDRQTAAQVFNEIDKSPALVMLLEHDMVEKYRNDLAGDNGRSGLADTSDSHWSPELQRVWPAYIMGASVLWLGLINQFIEAPPPGKMDFEQLLADYRQVNTSLTKIWHQEGQHAFLHHLNALFGYEAMLLKAEVNF